jgi:cob(I)alamin adenosyltransferase
VSDAVGLQLLRERALLIVRELEAVAREITAAVAAGDIRSWPHHDKEFTKALEMLRALGRGFRCGVVQFGKGAWQSGERTAVERFGDQVEWYTLGEGFTWETQDRARDVAAAERAWAATKTMMANPAIRLIVLDELNIALRYDHLDIKEVVEALKARRRDQHIVVTGRNAKPELIEAADLVTEMTPVKHHFAAGVKAQEGIEF